MVRVVGGDVKVFASELRGSSISLRGKFGSTVLGTDNVMMAAVLAEGTTVIEAAAAEPEVATSPISSTRWARRSRARAPGASSSRASRNSTARNTEVIPDRIEAGTFLVAGAICGQGVTLKQRHPRASGPASPSG